MYARAYDAERLVLVVLQSKGIATVADFEANVADVERLGSEAIGKPSQIASLLVLAESENPPSAVHRSRIARVESHIPRLNLAFVNASRSGLMVMTFINWLAPVRPGLVRSVHADYESARDWHVAQGVHSRVVFDELHDSVRRQVARN
jgi:hypothetical protein